MTDQELNEAVARKLGWSPPSEQLRKEFPDAVWNGVPPYSTSIEAAWEVLEYLEKRNEYQRVTLTLVAGKWGCRLGAEPVICEIADTAPRAICLSFLKLP